MGYRVINVSPEFREQYEPRAGLEGPFFYDGNRVLYYDPVEGSYLNPMTDHYLTYEQYMAVTGEFYEGGFVDVGGMTEREVRNLCRGE